jgi:hypothetical protein
VDRQCNVRLDDPSSSGMLHPTDNRTTADLSRPAGAVPARSDIAGLYLTDEVFLYRVVGSVASGVDELVELEDCYGLDVVRVPVSDLRSRRLRVVTAAVEG